MAVVLGVYLAMSGVTFAVYVRDKRAARMRRARTPESTLHLLELLGGWPGAFLAQRIIRHKNAKTRYQVVFGLVVAAHAVAWIAVAWMT